MFHMRRDQKIQSFIPVEQNRNYGILLDLLVVLAVSFVIIAAFVFYQMQLEKNQERETENYLTEATDSNAMAIENKIQGDIQMLEGIAVTLGGLEEQDIGHWSDSWKESMLLSKFERFGFILPTGKGYTLDGESETYDQQEAFQLAMTGETVIADIVANATNHRSAIAYEVPIKSDNKVMGVMNAAVYLDSYQEALNPSFFSGKSETYIVDNHGVVIFGNSRSESNITVNNIFDTMDGNNPEIDQMQEKMLLGETGTISFNSRQIEKKGCFTPLSVKNWYLLTIIPASVIAGKTQRIMTLAYLLFIIIAAAILGFLLYILIKQRKEKTQLLLRTYVDGLTGYANASCFSVNAENLIRSGNKRYAFVILDIDKFKLINDIFGYAQGDYVIRHMAEVIASDLNPKETFGRSIGDKFFLLMEYTNKVAFEERLSHIFKQIVTYQISEDAQYQQYVSAGVYVIRSKDIPIEIMIDRAAAAAVSGKGRLNNSFSYYNDEIRQKAIEESEIEQEMVAALENREFHVYLQPKYDLTTGTISGAEALIRWIHPKKGLMPPAQFVPVFEKNGFITKLDMFVFEEICKAQELWREEGKQQMVISVNQSKLHMYNPNYMDILNSTLKKYEVSSELIEIELTENIFLSNIEALTDITDTLHKNGFKLSIDDFGSGYSSLHMLKDIMADVIKLDRVFLQETASDSRGKKVIESIIKMSKELGMRTIAEGVETEGQVEFLRMIGCEQAQGYFYAKPMPIQSFEQLLLDSCTA